MKKKAWFAAIALALSAPASAQFMSGNLLLSRMNGNEADRIMALGYVMGVTDAGDRVYHCAPATITAGQVRDMALQYLRANPENRHLSADLLITGLLINAWPCPKNEKGTGA
jgi:hypothetical protein